MLDDDPFFVPSTADELEEHGDGDSLADSPARALVVGVRERKGLGTGKQLVAAADKQRTRDRKK